MPIVCVGQLVADVVIRPVDGLPEPGRARRVEEIALNSGGCAANTAGVLARIGAEARLVARIGRDAMGEAALADIAAAGVRTETVIRDDDLPTSVAIVLVDSRGERSFFYRLGATEALSNADVRDGVLRGADVVHVGGAMKLEALDMAEIMGRAKALGAATSIDTDWDVNDRWMERLGGALPHIDYLMTNVDEAAMLTGMRDPGDAARDLLGRGARAVIVKRGERGSILATADGVESVPAYRVDVTDTTCAGDAFVAGFLAGILRKRPVIEAVRWGNAAGALCATAISTRGVRSLEDVRRLAENGETMGPSGPSS